MRRRKKKRLEWKGEEQWRDGGVRETERHRELGFPTGKRKLYRCDSIGLRLL